MENNKSTHQPGRIGILCMNQVAHCMLQPDDNPLRLGHWCWLRIQGPNGFYLQIVTIYQPCFSNGPLTSYQQQVRGLIKRGCFKCPRDTIHMDIANEIQKWHTEGEHIILLMDFNDDIKSPLTKRWAASQGLVKAIPWLHPQGAPPCFRGAADP